MKKSMKVKIENANVKEYYILQKILKRYGIETEIIQKENNGTEMGMGFQELIILLPLLTPIMAELRKAFEAYLDYKKSLNQIVFLTLLMQEKDLKINDENNRLVSFETLERFLKDK